MENRSAICKGSYILGTACGLCVRCESELSHIKKEKRSPVSETDLNHWEFAAQDPELLEIIRMARIGLTTEMHSNAIFNSLDLALGELSVSQISPYERAKDALKKVIKP